MDTPPETPTPNIAPALLAWYDRHRRNLPWRAQPGEPADPYRVWLSEMMLQQTTVAAVKPYFERLTRRWPDVRALADTPGEEVMAAWAGLGYYSRARNLHACAAQVATKHGGVFPANEAELLALPGIGPYTAAAIAAIAFDRRAVVVDGNVERVISRYFAVDEPLPRAKPRIRAAADLVTPDARCGDFAQAMMDLGATICTPRRPACALCPLSEGCLARRYAAQEHYPVKAQKRPRPTRYGVAFVVRRDDGAVLARPRPPRGLLGGMLEVPGSPWTETPPDNALVFAPLPAEWRRADATVRHVFTHFELAVTVFSASVSGHVPAPQGARWIASADIPDAGFPSVMRKLLLAAG